MMRNSPVAQMQFATLRTTPDAVHECLVAPQIGIAVESEMGLSVVGDD
jgi:hypothetical protein